MHEIIVEHVHLLPPVHAHDLINPVAREAEWGGAAMAAVA